MGGSSSEVGRHYEVAWHDGLCLGPLDAYHAMESSTKIVCEGRWTSSGLVSINEPDLWGGEKDQGGVVGGLRLMFGEADQMPNAYLTSIFGPETVAWRGIATVAFEGGRWGANNPQQRDRWHKVERILKGWDNDDCWYPEKAPVPLDGGGVGGGGGGGGGGAPVVHHDYSTASVSSLFAGFLELAYASVPVHQDASTWDDPLYAEFYIPVDSGAGLGRCFIYDDDSGDQLADSGWFGPVPDILSGHLTAAGRMDLNGPVQSGPVFKPIEFPSGSSRRFRTTTYVVKDVTTVGTYDGTSYHHLRITTGNPETDPGTPPSYGEFAENPVHTILYSHTQAHTGAQPLETINLASAIAAADWFYAQGFGLCSERLPNKESPNEYIARIERVSGCSFTQSNEDGLWYFDIANGEYDLESLPILTDDDIIDFEEVAVTLDSAINSVSVKYEDPKRNETITTRPLQAIGLIADFGENHQTFDFNEIPTDGIAGRVQMRELLATTTPTRAFNLVTTPKTRSWRKSTYFRLQSIKRGIADMVCMVAEGDDGSLKSGNCKFSASQDIYSLPTTAYAGAEFGIDTRPPTTPIPIAARRVFEAPYMEAVAAIAPTEFAALAPDAGFAAAVAANPGQMLDFTMSVDAGAGYDDKATGDFCPTCVSAGAVLPGNKLGITYTDGVRMSRVAIGSMVLWDDEFCRVDAIDLDAGTLDLGRACADTVPTRHEAGSRLYFYTDQNAVDPTEYTEGETIGVKLRSNTGSRRLSLAAAEEIPLTFVRRIDRPYPQGNLTLNDLPFYTSGAITPGGGGGGGGGGSGTPTSPPATGPNGSPASDTPGPGGGYPDDTPYHIPQPTVFGTNTIPGGGTFDDPADVLAWRNRDGSALPGTWESGDSALQFTGFSAAEAYCYAVRLSFPVMPGTKYVATFKATLETPPGVTAVIGIGRGFNSAGESPADVADSTSAPQEYPIPAEVEVSFEYLTTESQNFGANSYVTANVMPFVRFTPSTGYAYIGKLTLADFKMEAFPPTMVDASPTNADLSAGLTGVTQFPIVPGYSPTVVLSGGQIKATSITEFGQHQYFIWDDPISGITDVGQIIEISGKTFSNSVATQSGVTVMGTAIGVATKLPGGDYVPYFRSLFHRGDMTLRKYAMRVPSDPSTGVTYHMMALTKAEDDKVSGFSDMSAAVSDAVVIP